MKNQVNPSQSASKFEDGVDYSKPSKDRPYFLYVDHLNIYVSKKLGQEYMRDYWLEKREEELSHRCLVPSKRYGIKRCREDCSKCPIFGTNHGNGGIASLDRLYDEYEYEVASGDESPEEYAVREEITDAIHREIDALESKDLRDVMNCLLDEMTITEIAEKLHITRKTAAKRKGDAIAILKEKLKDFI
jgi:hypothetical protein